MKKCGIIILAAGNSSRLGHAKQLLTFKGKTLLRHVVDEALEVADAHTIVVLGAESETLLGELEDSKAVTCYNAQWSSGMSGSIHVGLKKLLELQPESNCCIIAVCDQPFISAEVFNNLIQMFQTSSCSIIASAYADTAGTPVLFSNALFPDLFRLEGQEGAKKLLNQYKQELRLLAFDKGKIDIDTEADYDDLCAQ